MAGAPALIAATSPRFVLAGSSFPNSSPARFAPQSPAGQLIRDRGITEGGHWLDPLGGAGGFGASTAQLLLLQALLDSSRLESDAFWGFLEAYRQLPRESGSPPSGADLVAQRFGGVVEYHPAHGAVAPRMLQRGVSLGTISIVVLQASLQSGRKTATHEHLRAIAPAMLEKLRADLEPILVPALSAFSSGVAALFAPCLDEYAEVLARYDLEVGAARSDREVLRSLPGVLGVKGSGALQSDALVVVIDPARWDREQFFRVVRDRELRMMPGGGGTDFLGFEPGVELS